MDIQPQTTKPISDDQELAKVLAGVSQEANNDLGTIETPVATAPADPVVPPLSDDQIPAVPEVPTVEYNPPTPQNAVETPVSSSTDGDLDVIKKDALTELRPLVDKLDLEPEEKFDTYLLLIRSTDDKELIAPAHEAAKNIPDEAKRAQALLDVIKEIDFLSTPQ